jgi:hypothetical protein
VRAAAGIETMYRGRKYRSRLEATWAAFFGTLGWDAAYEPIDLDGYIPDFVLRFKRPLLVEVKPVFHVAEMVEFTEKIERSGWDGEALIVGAVHDPSAEESWNGNPAIGLLAERDRFDDTGDELIWMWDPGLWQFCLKCRRPSLLHSVQSYRCRVCGDGDGTHYIGNIDAPWPEIRTNDGQPGTMSIALQVWWAEAANRVRWEPRR